MTAFGEVAALVGLHREWLGRGFERYTFERRELTVDEALALRSCWPPCHRFDARKITHDPDGKRICSEIPSRALCVMACPKTVLDKHWGDKYGNVAVDGGELVAMDGNHRLAGLALSVGRAPGHCNLKIHAYVALS